MPRNDLLQLSEDDLSALTNRGTVKRAQKELDAGDPTYTFEEGPQNRLLVRWSDGIECDFPDGKTIHDARCSSGASGISRHIVRSVLAYQKFHSTQAASHATSPATSHESSSSDQSSNEPTVAVVAESMTSSWDPGQISDESLISAFGSATITRARTRFQEGTLVELFRGKKPYAVFLDENCFLRFLVPGDVRYVTADCTESAVPRFAAMAVWAFRELPANKQHGLLSLQQKISPVPRPLFEELDQTLVALATHGLARAPATFQAKLSRLETQLREQAFVWPAELVAELNQLLEMYRQHDARFDPQAVAELVGELIARGRAIVNNTGAIPQMLIRGSRSDRPHEIESGRYIGLGIAVRPRRNSCTVQAYFQAADTGLVAAIGRTFALESATPPAGGSPATSPYAGRSFHELAESSLTRGVSLARLAQSQILLKSSKRTTGGELILPRSASAFSLNPQAFQWEQLKPPLLADNFTAILERIEIQPPTYLGPRRCTEGLAVVPIAKMDDLHFDELSQRLVATLTDQDQRQAVLELPFHSRGRAGFDNFFTNLSAHGHQAKYVAGKFRTTQSKLRFEPLAVILQQGAERSMLLPYVMQSNIFQASKLEPNATSTLEEPVHEAAPDDESMPTVSDPIDGFISSYREFVAEMLLAGIGNRNHFIEQQAESLAVLAAESGFLRIAQQLQQIVGQFSLSQNSLHFQWDTLARKSLDVALLGTLLANRR